MYTKDKVILQLWHILCAYVFNSDDYNPLILFKTHYHLTLANFFLVEDGFNKMLMIENELHSCHKVVAHTFNTE